MTVRANRQVASAAHWLAAQAMRPPRRIGSVLRRPFGWWAALTPQERVFYRAAVFLAAGFGLLWPPAVLIVPGAMWALVFFGFSFRKGT